MLQLSESTGCQLSVDSLCECGLKVQPCSVATALRAVFVAPSEIQGSTGHRPVATALNCPIRGSSLGANLVENTAQLVKVYRFDEVKIESRFFAAPNVFVGAKSSDSHSFDRLFSFYLGNNVVAAAIGKANVAQHDIEFLRRHDLQRALRVFRD